MLILTRYAGQAVNVGHAPDHHLVKVVRVAPMAVTVKVSGPGMREPRVSVMTVNTELKVREDCKLVLLGIDRERSEARLGFKAPRWVKVLRAELEQGMEAA